MAMAREIFRRAASCRGELPRIVRPAGGRPTISARSLDLLAAARACGDAWQQRQLDVSLRREPGIILHLK